MRTSAPGGPAGQADTRRILAAASALTAAVLAGAMLTAGPAAAKQLHLSRAGGEPRRPAAVPAGMRAACRPASAVELRCFTLYRPQTAVNQAIAEGRTGAAASPAGWGARAVEQAYRLPVSRRPHQVVAVSIAFNTPKLATYLAVYRKKYGLPACTVRSGCFRQVNEHGKAGPLPESGVGTGWDLEATLDVSMVSAACPRCKIVVVEARNNGIGQLAATDNTAARLGAQVISNSYGGRENGFQLAHAGAYRHPGHLIVVSSGDGGYSAANFPADLASVVAVGGTRLARAHNRRGWAESVWNTGEVSGTSSGCSAYVRKPSWQHDSHCQMRTVADVSAVAADVAVYNKSYGGWLTVDGTSAAAPLIAGIYGLAGNAGQMSPRRLYARRNSLFDVRRGTNVQMIGNSVFGDVCGGDYLCRAKRGYDAPTGLGTPDGIGAF